MNILLACLAGTDLLTGLVVYPLAIALELKRISGVRHLNCTLEKRSALALPVISLASLSHLVLVSIDRYIAIKYSLRYLEIVTKRRLLTGVSFVWAMTMRVKYAIIKTFIYNTIIILVCIAVIIYTNCYILYETRRQKRRIQTEQVTQEEAKRMKKDKKAAKTLAIILAALALTYLPSMVMAVIRTTWNTIKPSVTSLLWTWITTFIMLGSLLNPVIYCWRIRKLRRAFLEILHFRQL
ncbi:adenosine receptor A1-like [Oculina patagonica]